MKKKGKIVCIPYETEVRELDGKLLLSAHLIKNGYSVLLGSRAGIFRELSHLKNAIYIPKSISIENMERYKKLKYNNTVFIVHNVEGGVLYKNEEEHFVYSYDKRLLPLLDGICLFGENIKKSFMKFIPEFPEKKLIVTGDYRFDMLKPKYREFFRHDILNIQNTYGDFILINTSFSIANPYVGEGKFFDFLNRNNSYSESTIKNLKLKNVFYKDIINIFIDAIKGLAKKFPDKNIIVRPHPSESLDIYKKNFQDINNIYVTNEGNVQKWIFASKVVVHYDCTTGIESVLSKKPTIAFVPKKKAEIFAWLPAYVSDEANSISALLEKVESVYNNTYIYDLSEEKVQVLNSYIANVSLDSEKIFIKYLNKLSVQESQNSYYYNQLSVRKKRLRAYLKYYKNIIWGDNNKSIATRKLGIISTHRFSKKLELLQQIDNISIDFHIKKIAKDIVLIEAK